MTRSSFTLIELLLAMALLSAITVAAFSWMVGQSRIGSRIQEVAQDEAGVEAARVAIDDDLVLAVPNAGHTTARVVKGMLVLLTLNRGDGDAPGIQNVTWLYDDKTQRLLRSVQDAAAPGGVRAVAQMRPFTAVTFQDRNSELVATFEAHGRSWRVALWHEPMEARP